MENILGVLGIPLLVAGIALFLQRDRLVQRTGDLADATGLPQWKAWQLSALEPLITTILSITWSIAMISQYSLPGAFVLPLLNMGLFAGLIRWRGRGCRRGRLASTVISTRLTLLLIAFFVSMRTGVIVPAFFVSIALMIRIIFGVYQSRVTPTLVEYEKAQTAANIRIPVIESGQGDWGGLDLWNAQIDLIEQLKEEEMVEV